tara:strand:- start:468 stop:896 length:429 start_codon:yes stop_codon:yes gene_type:complete
MAMKLKKVFAGSTLVLSLLVGGGSVFSEESCDPPIDGMLEDAALEAGKANPPEGCLQVWSSKFTSSEIKNDGGYGALIERWELIAREIFVGCYRKGEVGVDTEKRYIPAGTESVVHALCSVPVTCDANIPKFSEDIYCDILQ